jgi:hypothetical protein
MRILKLSSHRHSGKLLHHQHTSYPGLLFLLILTTVMMMTISSGAQAFIFDLPPPVEEDVGIHGAVPDKTPTAPTIRVPSNSQSFTANPIKVQGSCPKDTLVKVYKNGVFAGAAICDNSGSFNLEMDLLIGQNALTAKAYNTHDKAGPPSDVVNVTLTLAGLNNPQAPGATEPAKIALAQLIIASVNYHRGVYPKEELKWPVEILGGTGPYAVQVGWGDGKTDLISRGVAGKFDITHMYEKVGTGYRGSQNIIIKATDSKGVSGYLQLVVLVNDGSIRVTNNNIFSGNLAFAWPLLVFAILLVLSFWLGERREKKLLMKQFGAT